MIKQFALLSLVQSYRGASGGQSDAVAGSHGATFSWSVPSKRPRLHHSLRYIES
jgi:hypothetical protein